MIMIMFMFMFIVANTPPIQDVLVQGAQELGLPVSYVEYLQSLPRFTKAAAGKEQLGAKSFIAFWMPLASHLMRWVKFHADDENGRAPEWMGGLVWALFTLLWCYHDWIHSRIWSSGSGERGSRRGVKYQKC
jgi:hypothetical protein